ncbi:MAG: hypothetical protein PHR53_02565, partial [Bacteroidales bacterium]|nr:hypothetical protein [Bacteroidales bacterium]
MKIRSIKNIRIIGFLSIVFMCLLPDVQGQKIGIGEWRDHLSYYQTKSVAVVGQEVYVMSPYSLFIYNQEDNIIERFSKINGLTDNGFTKLKYDDQQNCLMILYENSDIDIIKNGTIYNFPEIKLSSIIGNKGLNNVYFEDHFAYICCGFGVVVVDVDQLEVVETYRIGSSFETLDVYDMTADDTCFYVATAKGIFSARKDNPLLSFYESWHQWQSAPLINGFYSMIEVFDQRLTYVCHTDNVQQFYQQMLNDTIPQLVYQGSCSDLHVADDRLLLSTNNGLYVYQPSNFEHPTHFSQYEGQTINARQVEFSNNVYWIADENLGLLKATDVSSIKKMGRPNGPYSSNCFDLTALKDQVWVSAGYYLEDSWYFGGSKEGTCSFDGSSWTIFNPEMENVPDNSHDFCVAVVNPTNPSQAFVGTWGCGLYQFDNNELTVIYDTENSSLQPRSAAVNQGIFVSGLAFDSKGNLWVANSSCNDMLSCRSADGTWRAYNLLVSANEDLRSLYIDVNDQKWINTR